MLIGNVSRQVRSFDWKWSVSSLSWLERVFSPANPNERRQSSDSLQDDVVFDALLNHPFAVIRARFDSAHIQPPSNTIPGFSLHRSLSLPLKAITPIGLSLSLSRAASLALSTQSPLHSGRPSVPNLSANLYSDDPPASPSCADPVSSQPEASPEVDSHTNRTGDTGSDVSEEDGSPLRARSISCPHSRENGPCACGFNSARAHLEPLSLGDSEDGSYASDSVSSSVEPVFEEGVSRGVVPVGVSVSVSGMGCVRETVSLSLPLSDGSEPSTSHLDTPPPLFDIPMRDTPVPQQSEGVEGVPDTSLPRLPLGSLGSIPAEEQNSARVAQSLPSTARPLYPLSLGVGREMSGCREVPSGGPAIPAGLRERQVSAPLMQGVMLGVSPDQSCLGDIDTGMPSPQGPSSQAPPSIEDVDRYLLRDLESLNDMVPRGSPLHTLADQYRITVDKQCEGGRGCHTTAQGSAKGEVPLYTMVRAIGQIFKLLYNPDFRGNLFVALSSMCKLQTHFRLVLFLTIVQFIMMGFGLRWEISFVLYARASSGYSFMREHPLLVGADLVLMSVCTLLFIYRFVGFLKIHSMCLNASYSMLQRTFAAGAPRDAEGEGEGLGPSANDSGVSDTIGHIDHKSGLDRVFKDMRVFSTKGPLLMALPYTLITVVYGCFFCVYGRLTSLGFQAGYTVEYLHHFIEVSWLSAFILLLEQAISLFALPSHVALHSLFFSTVCFLFPAFYVALVSHQYGYLFVGTLYALVFSLLNSGKQVVHLFLGTRFAIETIAANVLVSRVASGRFFSRILVPFAAKTSGSSFSLAFMTKHHAQRLCRQLEEDNVSAAVEKTILLPLFVAEIKNLAGEADVPVRGDSNGLGNTCLNMNQATASLISSVYRDVYGTLLTCTPVATPSPKSAAAGLRDSDIRTLFREWYPSWYPETDTDPGSEAPPTPSTVEGTQCATDRPAGYGSLPGVYRKGQTRTPTAPCTGHGHPGVSSASVSANGFSMAHGGTGVGGPPGGHLLDMPLVPPDSDGVVFASQEEETIMRDSEIQFFPLTVYTKLDIVGFTSYCSHHGADVVRLLNVLFTAFDTVVDKYAPAGVVKVKTIGDAYELMRPFSATDLRCCTPSDIVSAVAAMAKASHRLVQCALGVFEA
ncbi:hypothetical protein KIPB_008222, partial [Kipferlia bialata]|eukprot:g8222.t1